MILRPIAVEAAIAFRKSVDFMVAAVEDAIADDFCFPARHMPKETPVFVPCREGRSLYAFVKRRSFRKKAGASRLSGVNGGKDVTFYDD